MPWKEAEVENKMKIVQLDKHLTICLTFLRSESRSFNASHVDDEDEIQRQPMPF
jgi:hypothetical protein